MESTPSSQEPIQDEPKVEVVIPTEDEEADREIKKFRFDAVIMAGKRIFEAVKKRANQESSPSYEDLPDAYKVAFSLFSPEPQASEGDFARNRLAKSQTIIGPHGIEYGSTRMPFTDEMQREINNGVFGEVVQKAETIDECFASLDKQDSIWRKQLGPSLCELSERHNSEKLEREIQNIRQKYKSRYEGIAWTSYLYADIATLRPDINKKEERAARDFIQSYRVDLRKDELLASNIYLLHDDLTSLNLPPKELREKQKLLDSKRATLQARVKDARATSDIIDTDIAIAQDYPEIDHATIRSLLYKSFKQRYGIQKRAEDEKKRKEEDRAAFEEALKKLPAKTETANNRGEATSKTAPTIETPEEPAELELPSFSNIIAAVSSYHPLNDEQKAQLNSLLLENYQKYADNQKRPVIPPDAPTGVAYKEPNGKVKYVFSDAAAEKELARLRLDNYTKELVLFSGFTPEQAQKLLAHDYSQAANQDREQRIIELSGLTHEDINDSIKAFSRQCQDIESSIAKNGATPLVLKTVTTKRIKIVTGENVVSQVRAYPEGAITVDRIKMALQSYRHAYVAELAKKFDPSKYETPLEVYSQTIQHALNVYGLPQAQDPNAPLIMTTEQAKERLIGLIQQSGAPQESMQAAIADIDKLTARLDLHYLDQAPRYYSAKARLGSSENLCLDDEIDMKKEISDLRREPQVEYKVNPEDEARSIKTTIAKHFGGPDAKDAYIMPTGIAIRTGDERCIAAPISPLSPQLIDILPPHFRNSWQKYWQTADDRYPTCATVARQLVNERTKQILSDNSEFASQDLSDIDLISQTYGINISSEVVSPASGVFESIPDQADRDRLRSLIPLFGRFLKSASFEVKHNSATEKTTEENAKSVRRFLLTGEHYSALYSQAGNLNVTAYQSLAENSSEKGAQNILALNIGAELYKTHASKIEPILAKLTGARASISKLEAMRLTNEIIESPAIRRKVAMRAFFLSEFRKFLANEPSNNPQLRSFVEQVTQIAYPEKTA